MVFSILYFIAWQQGGNLSADMDRPTARFFLISSFWEFSSLLVLTLILKVLKNIKKFWYIAVLEPEFYTLFVVSIVLESFFFVLSLTVYIFLLWERHKVKWSNDGPLKISNHFLGALVQQNKSLLYANKPLKARHNFKAITLGIIVGTFIWSCFFYIWLFFI